MRGRSSARPRVAVLVRTHLVNDKLLDLLDILERGRGYDMYVCADETNGPLPLPGRRVLSHSTRMCAEIGLVGELPGQNLLWYFGDYAFYCAYHEIPDYDYYAMIEYDVDLVRRNPMALEGLFSRLERDGDDPYDLVAGRYGPVTPEHWGWSATCKGRFDNVYAVFFPFVVLSNRALRYLYDWRRNEAANPLPDGQFVFCEAFAASALQAAGGFVCADLGTLIPGCWEPATFGLEHPMLLGSLPRLDRGVEFVHPVHSEQEYLERLWNVARYHNRIADFIDLLNGEVGLSLTPTRRNAFLDQAIREQAAAPEGMASSLPLIERLLARHPPRDFFRRGSELREGLLRQAPHGDIVEPLRRALARERDHLGVALLYKEATSQGWAIQTSDDLAFCKPALTSSVCRWSRFMDPERDACGANSESPEPFHTDKERDPWWMVDLLEEHWIEQVAIVNRDSEPQRFRTFRIDTSSDREHWITRFTQAEPRDVSADLDAPLRLWFDPFTARFVRIVLLGWEPLHLHRVQVFGRSRGAALAGRADPVQRVILDTV
jgi:hypothetical protein